jgi:hypothetical protein
LHKLFWTAAEVTPKLPGHTFLWLPHIRAVLVDMTKPGTDVSRLGIETLPGDPANPVDVAIEEKAIIPAAPQPFVVPDGGVRAWLQVLGCWLVFFNVW